MILICKKFLVLIKSAIGSSFKNVLILLHDFGKCKHRTVFRYIYIIYHIYKPYFDFPDGLDLF